MNKLIIGCGYVGQRVAARWHAAGDQVFATTRQQEQAGVFANRGWNPVICDITDAHSIKFSVIDLVVFAVGFDRASGHDMRQVYVDGLAHVLDSLPACERFIYVSSTSVYGQTAGELVDETAKVLPKEKSGQIVLEAEEMLRDRLPRAIILRFAGIYGPGRLLRENGIRAGAPIEANPERWLNLIQVDDGVQAILAAESRGEPGSIYNVTDDTPVPRRAFFELLAELLVAPSPRFKEPAPDVMLPHEMAHRRVSNRRMREELRVSLKYPSFREGLIASVGLDASFGD
jgi:nucleoside-diphosphate-sugar epimerase